MERKYKGKKERISKTLKSEEERDRKRLKYVSMKENENSNENPNWIQTVVMKNNYESIRDVFSIN